MIKNILKKNVWWIKRGKALALGLATMLALSVVLGGTALAGTGIGGVFNLGQLNTVDAQSQLRGTANNALLRIVNLDTVGSAAKGLSIFVANNRPPLVVENPNAGTATNLSADKLDGQDFSAFLGATQKAANSNKLDGRYSSEFAHSSVFASVLNDGELSDLTSSSHAVSSTRISTGRYEVTFDRPINLDCVHIAQPKDVVALTKTMNGTRYLDSGTPGREKKVRVDQVDHAGNPVDGSVAVSVFCEHGVY